jgi:hypothetical protein
MMAKREPKSKVRTDGLAAAASQELNAKAPGELEPIPIPEAEPLDIDALDQEPGVLGHDAFVVSDGGEVPQPGLTFSQALEQLKQGHAIARASWQPYQRQEGSIGVRVSKRALRRMEHGANVQIMLDSVEIRRTPHQLTSAELDADDWVIVE